MLLRVFICEDAQFRHRPPHEAIVLKASEVHLSGATVLRSPMGFGHSRRLCATKILRLSEDLPLAIEFFDQSEVAEAAIGLLYNLVPQGHIVSWPATCHSAACASQKRG
jgi:hypothetical protein